MANPPWLLVGLGNPGPEYAKNRHNVGFMVVERWVDRHLSPGVGTPNWKSQFKARVTSIQAEPVIGRCVVLEPQTFMNRSGRSVVAATQFYRVPPEQLVVVHDELDFDFGRVAVKKGGGHGGHNGLRDIIGQGSSPEFVRIRVGIGRPTRGGDVSGWVLQGFDAVDGAALPEVLDRACHAITTVLTRGLAAAMNETNRDAAG
jgi:PTH1 family peptidyl-tRNA hydrolase